MGPRHVALNTANRNKTKPKIFGKTELSNMEQNNVNQTRQSKTNMKHSRVSNIKTLKIETKQNKATRSQTKGNS